MDNTVQSNAGRQFMNERFRQSWHSFRRLPLWIQVWVGWILIPVNAAAFFLLDQDVGKVTAIAAAFVVATNVPIMLRERGLSKLMSLPHLFAWIPLLILLVARLNDQSGAAPMTAFAQIYATIVIGVNGISLIFDVVDSWRWLRGDRAVA